MNASSGDVGYGSAGLVTIRGREVSPAQKRCRIFLQPPLPALSCHLERVRIGTGGRGIFANPVTFPACRGNIPSNLDSAAKLLAQKLLSENANTKAGGIRNE